VEVSPTMEINLKKVLNKLNKIHSIYWGLGLSGAVSPRAKYSKGLE
jgi:hypothetical protein